MQRPSPVSQSRTSVMGPEPRGSRYRPTPRFPSTGPKPARNSLLTCSRKPNLLGPTFKIGRCHSPLGTNGKLATWGTHLPWLRLRGLPCSGVGRVPPPQHFPSRCYVPPWRRSWCLWLRSPTDKFYLLCPSGPGWGAWGELEKPFWCDSAGGLVSAEPGGLSCLEGKEGQDGGDRRQGRQPGPPEPHPFCPQPA